MFSPAVPFFATSSSSDDIPEIAGFSAMGQGASLPPQISMITLAKVHGEEDTYMVRLAHQYGVGEDEELSKGAKVDLNKVRRMQLLIIHYLRQLR